MNEQNRLSSPQLMILAAGLMLALLLAIQGAASPEAYAAAAQDSRPLIAGEEAEDVANCRYGVTTGEATAYAIPNLGAGWFYKFNWPEWQGPMPSNDAENVHVIKVHQKRTEAGEYLPEYYAIVPLDEWLADLIRANPGDLWMIGNEVDRGPAPGQADPGQGGVFPEIYAVAYHDLYHFIKSIDPTARVAVSGLVQVTPGRIQYLDKMWDAYLDKYGEPMPVDVWNFHLYIFPEVLPNGTPNAIAGVAMGTDPALGMKGSGKHANQCPAPGSSHDPRPDVYCFSEHDSMDIFAQQVVAMRQWMKEHGQQQKPLILSEYSLLYWYVVKRDGTCEISDEFGNCFTPQRVNRYMLDSFALLNSMKDPDLGYALDNHKLVQQWNWYGIYTQDTAPSDLVRNGALTQVGLTFRSHVRNEPAVRNLIFESASGQVVARSVNGTATVQLTARFRNNGNAAVRAPFDVTFYRNQARTQPIGTARVTPLVRGCATHAYTASVEWSGLDIGTYPFWVRIDSGNDIAEIPAGDADNNGSGQVEVPEAPTYTLDVRVVSHGEGQGGVVNVRPDEPFYVEGTQVSLTAVANSGWRFAGWQGALTGSAPTTTFAMMSDMVIEAHFAEDDYALNVGVSGRGTVHIDPQREVYRFGDEVILEARPAIGWRFDHWEGDLSGRTPLLALSMSQDIEATAVFKRTLAGAVGTVHLPVAMNP